MSVLSAPLSPRHDGPLRRLSLAAAGGIDFELIAESIPHIVFTTGADGATDYLNRRGTEYTGLPSDANLGWAWLSLLHPDDVERVQRAWSDAVRSMELFEEEYRIRSAEGDYRWYAGRALPVRDGAGQVVKWIGTCTDIEDSRQLEEQLLRSQRETAESLGVFEALQVTAPVGFGFVTRDFRIAKINEAPAAVSGCTPAEVIGRTVAEAVPELWSQLEPIYREVLGSGVAVSGHEIVGPSVAALGEVRHWLSNFHPVHIEGEIVGIGITVFDITERMQGENFRAAVMENMVEGVCAVNSEGRLMFMNAAASKMLGWREDELRGRSMHDAVHFQRHDGRPLPAEECELLQVRTRVHALRAGEDAFTRKDGTIFPVAYSAAPILSGTNGDGVQGVVVVFRDTTEEKAEQERVQRELAALTWLGRIRDALDEGRFCLLTQPIVSLTGGAPSEELLLRMVGREGELIAPGSFLPIAEKHGLIGEIDLWVISEAIRVAASGRRVHANVSADSIGNLDLLAVIERELDAAGADPAKLVIEITETALMRDIDAGERFVQGITAIGCGLALDDFGTGFGSFTYLKRLQATYLKIDCDFVRELVTDKANQHLVEAIVGLAQGFGYQTIAEGLQDEQTLELLRQLGVDYVQGFHLGHPGPVDAATPN
jgi:PAS domain S-box-containing protein